MCCSSVPACPARRQLLALGGTGGGCCLAPGNGKRKLGFWSPRTSCGDSCSPQEQGSLQQEGFGGVFGACSPSSSALLSAGSRGALGMQRGKGKCGINRDLFLPPPHSPSVFLSVQRKVQGTVLHHTAPTSRIYSLGNPIFQ